MQFLWEFTALGDKEYYDLGKSTLNELNTSISETERIISGSFELNALNSGLVRIKSWTKDLELIIDESLEVQILLKANQIKVNRISEDFKVEAKQFLYMGENKLRDEFMKDLIPSGYLYNRHRKNRILNLIVDKGNNNMITAFEAIASENPELLKTAMKEFIYINNLINVLDTLSVEEFEFEGVNTFKKYFSSFQNELYSLKLNLTRSRELSVRRGEIASVVIFEAREMGQNGIDFAGKTLKDNYQIFNRSLPVYFLGLLFALIMAVVFSVIITRSITIPIGKSVQFAEEVASGNLDAEVDINQNDEVGILAESLRYMGAKLKSNMEELKKVERKMLKVSIETEEKERKRMAEDLHDSLGPQLSIIKLYIDAFQNETLSVEKKSYLIESSKEIIKDAISQAKNIAFNLLPNLLSDFGLDMAIRSFCDKVNELNQIKIHYSSIDYPSNLNRPAETMLFRVVKELLNNTIKHANAKRIDIQIYFEKEKMVLEYQDDGDGFEFESASDNDSRGLINIYSRISFISGKIQFETKPGNGTKVKILVDKKYLA
jgi:signal transduction histidine kinase